MAMAKKAKTKHDWRAYPPTEDIRSGCKVGWRAYKTRKEAEVCAAAARHNASIQANLGYDFGFCMPGNISECDGRFIVVVP